MWKGKNYVNFLCSSYTFPLNTTPPTVTGREKEACFLSLSFKDEQVAVFLFAVSSSSSKANADTGDFRYQYKSWQHLENWENSHCSSWPALPPGIRSPDQLLAYFKYFSHFPRSPAVSQGSCHSWGRSIPSHHREAPLGTSSQSLCSSGSQCRAHLGPTRHVCPRKEPEHQISSCS